MRKLKILIIRSSEESMWGSCKVISPNLQATYYLLEKDFEIEWFDLPLLNIPNPSGESSIDIMDLADKILKNKYDRIISIDHLPIQPDIFTNLVSGVPLHKMPPILFHVYGDFTYYSQGWKEMSEKLIKHPIRFITASESQNKLMQKFATKENDLKTLFFPIKRGEYDYSPTERTEARLEYKLTDDTFVVTYVGRVSLQKNVDALISFLNTEAKGLNKKIELWVVGSFDDQGAIFANVVTYEGYLFSKISALVASCKNIKVRFWGYQKKGNIKKLMSASDAYISLSLYHDEDFGMSPAEALCNGLPSLLTDWGGYSSFVSKDQSWDCDLMAVALSEYGHELKKSDLGAFIRKWVEKKDTNEARLARSKAFVNAFSAESAVEKLKEYIQADFGLFSGFNYKMSIIAKAYKKQFARKEMNLDLIPADNNLYADIYKSYISQIDKVEENE